MRTIVFTSGRSFVFPLPPAIFAAVLVEEPCHGCFPDAANASICGANYFVNFSAKKFKVSIVWTCPGFRGGVRVWDQAIG